MSSWKMIVNFEEIQEIAQEASLLAEQMKKLAEQHGQEVICGIKTAWSGENADAFTAKEVRLVNRLYEVGSELSEIAKQLEEKAEGIYKLEKGNVLTAQTRSY